MVSGEFVTEKTMALILSILQHSKITDRDKKSVHSFLLDHGFRGDEYGYYSAREDIFIDILIISEPENESYWIDNPPEAIWYTPLTEIVLQSDRNDKSHRECYHTALELAKIIMDCIIYDHQIGVVYDPQGKPYPHTLSGERPEEYGAGISEVNAASR